MASTAGLTANEALAGPGAGASAAMAEVADATATMTTHTILLISILLAFGNSKQTRKIGDLSLIYSLLGSSMRNSESFIEVSSGQDQLTLQMSITRDLWPSLV